MNNWNIYSFGPASGQAPQKIVLMMHGVGSNGQDLIGLAPYLGRDLPDVLFLSPDAPQSYDMAPGMDGMHQWFSLQTREPEALKQGARETLGVLDTLIENILTQTGLEYSDLAILGFSQGTMMGLYTALHSEKPIAGVLGYSGMLLDIGPRRIPVCLIHGEADDVVAVGAYHDAMEALREHQFDVDGLAIPNLTHSIDEAGIEKGAAFLKRVLAA